MKRISLTRYLIEEQRDNNTIPAELRLLIEVVARACKTISHSVSKGALGENTTLAVVATDANLTKAQVKRLAVMAQTGLPRAIYPVHTPLDGDIVFAAAMGQRPLPDPVFSLSELGMLAANALARAIARGVYEATALQFPGALPSWKDKFNR
mgnify:CR=1 FL=1